MQSYCSDLSITSWKGKTGWLACGRHAACSVPEACSGARASAALLRCWIPCHSGFFDDPVFAPILARDLDEGQHRNPTGNPIYFTDAFFHRPGELSRDLLGAGFQVLEIVAIEGPGWLARDFDRLWSDPVQRERLLAAVRKVEREPSVLGVSAHIMAIGRK